MIDVREFARKQVELTAEFAKFLLDHPEVDDSLPEESFIYFEITGEQEFNLFSRELAARRERDDGLALVRVQLKGLAPPQGSRLIDPVIDPSPTAA